MSAALWLMALIIAAGAIYVLLPVVADSFRRFRGSREVTCPETGRLASVRLDAGRAAATSAIGPPRLKITDCSRWPERGDCDQTCTRGIL
jgi:hypothetical protein